MRQMDEGLKVSSHTLEVLRAHEGRRPSAIELAEWECREIDLGGHNLKFVALDRIRTRAVIKFCDNTNGRIPDICNREELVSVLGNVLECVPTIDAWVVPADGLQIAEVRRKREHQIMDECVLMPFLSNYSTLQSRPREAPAVINRHLQEVANILGFMHWVGDEDRGLADMMYSSEQIVLID
jgi:hypothetical protein